MSPYVPLPFNRIEDTKSLAQILAENAQLADLASWINVHFYDANLCRSGVYFEHNGDYYLNDVGVLIENLAQHAERLTPEYLDWVKLCFELTAKAGLGSINYLVKARGKNDITSPQSLLSVMIVMAYSYISCVSKGIPSGLSLSKSTLFGNRNDYHLPVLVRTVSEASLLEDFLNQLNVETLELFKSYTSTFNLVGSWGEEVQRELIARLVASLAIARDDASES